MKKLGKIIAYYRLSKPRKNRNKEQTLNDAYGIEAQKASVKSLVELHGAKVIASYKEIETGTNKRTRPELAKAISHARLSKATLVIAKLDRLARNVHFTSTLLETKVPFVCCDNPEANTMTIQLMSVMAEQEARAIATRTKDALAVAKQKGVKLGSARPGHWKGIEHKRGWKKANKASIIARQQSARDAYSFLAPTILGMKEKGGSLREIAAWLNEQGHETTRSKPFTPTAVMRVIEMFQAVA